MAKFDVYARPDAAGFLLDCQADLLSDLSTRFVIPLMPLDEAPVPAARLNPVFELQGGQYVMATQFAASILASELGASVGSLLSEDMPIGNAIDMLLSGF
jgi:toxin CcdB